MNPIAVQQVALDNALVAPEKHEEIVTFIKELGHKGDIKFVTDVVVDQLHQPWRTFASIINKCLSGKITGLDKIRLSRAQILWGMYYNKNVNFVELLWEDFVFQIDNKDQEKQEKIFVSKSDEYQVYGALLPEGMTNQKMRDSPAYKTYLAFTTGAATPKKARKFKKPASPSKKKALVAVEELADKLKKAPAKAERSKGIELLSDAALLEEAQLKRAIKKSRRETNIHQAGGSSEGTDLESEVPDEPKGKSIDTSERTGLKPGVPYVSKADSFKSEYESWGDSDDDNDDDDQQSDDARTESDDDDKAAYINKTHDQEDDEFVHKMYSDVNVELKDSERECEWKDDEEMTDAGQVDVEHEEVSQEVAGDQVKDDAQATVTAALDAQKTEVPLQSSSISSDYATKFLNFDNIPS
ncbi:hypothetical protein Tco_0604555, partial [Tanacetum coccineum]